MADEPLIERIYEAAILPDRWPRVLQAVAEAAGAKGAVILVRSPAGVRMTPSPAVERHAADYVAEGWAADPAHAGPLIAELYPGFRTETDYRTVEEIEALPVHAEFLAPRGFVAGAGTVLQGAASDVIQLTIEGFASHEAARGAVRWLDALRPHLGRAVGLSALAEQQRSATIVAALARAGLGAAVVDRSGRLRHANSRFEARLGDRLIARGERVRFSDPFLDVQFAAALARLQIGVPQLRSIPLRGSAEEAPCAVHLIPIPGGARDVCDADGILLLLADGANPRLPQADLLRILFDLTPAEALLARRMVEGSSVADSARANGITVETARTHLRRIFSKTGVNRQAELVRLLLGVAAPLAAGPRGEEDG